MSEWILKIELNGEWEECKFLTRNDALSTFAALTEDYETNLQRAILFAPTPRFSHLDGLERWYPHSGQPN